ncbi:MAG TPA: tetratricopeptide repeat protein [Planctomycetota bacterium]|nr:tetratricopeptide repeat protein [Planctomycetota bacterium]HRR79723.1 tetratricopeptide repeat protein [Planctomycetota bacterium]HRT93226.1 tetratricopeptide repeat protein [Planctomycetota bacterium]
MAGFTFVGREAELAAFRQLLERPEGELLLVTGPEGSGKSHLLRQFRHEAASQGPHIVQHFPLGHLLDADLRQYAILSGLAVAHGVRASRSGDRELPGSLTLRLVPSPREFFAHLLGEDRRPVTEKLIGLLAVASGSLPDGARLVLLLDLGRAGGQDAFPLDALTRRLPQGVKVVVATAEAPQGLEGQPRVSVIRDLPAFGIAEVTRLLEFHHPRGGDMGALAGALLAKFGGSPLLSDAAAKLIAGAGDPAAALADLPTATAGICQQLLARLSPQERSVVECLARVPSGLDTPSVCALLGAQAAEVQDVFLQDGTCNVVVTQPTARGPHAYVFHEAFADLFFGEKGPEVLDFHKRAAAHFLSLVQKDSQDVEALGAHSFHIRLAADRVQFMQEFPRTLRIKQNLGLLHLLAGEYRLLLMWARGGEAPINRPLCMANLARIYQQLSQPEEALRYHKDAFDIYQRERDQSGMAAQLSAIASVLSDLGHHEEAIKSLQQAMAINEASGGKAALAADLANLGVLQDRLGRPREALLSHARALDAYRELKNEPDAAVQLTHLAALHRKLGELKDAVSRYQEAWRLNNRNGATRAEVACLCQLGLVFDQLGDLEKAITCYQQASDLDRTLGSRHEEADHLRTLAAMHLKARDPGAARRCLEQAVALAHSFGDPGSEAAGLLALAQAERSAGRPADARRALDQAAALAARLGDADTQAQARAAIEELERTAAEAAEEAAEEELLGSPSPAEAPSDDVCLDDTEAANAADPASDETLAVLRHQLQQARERITELEAEVRRQAELVHTLEKALAKAPRGH